MLTHVVHISNTVVSIGLITWFIVIPPSHLVADVVEFHDSPSIGLITWFIVIPPSTVGWQAALELVRLISNL